MTWVNIANKESALSVRNKLNALGADVDTKATITALNALTTTAASKADLVDGKVPLTQLPDYMKTDSFMAFCTNANANSLDAAFGKNVESYMAFLGSQLAMYAYFKGDAEGSYPFTNLKKMHNLSTILATQLAYNEVRNSPTLLALIASSPYAKSSSLNILPLDGTIPISQSNNNFVSFENVLTSQVLQSVTIPVSGLYTIKSVASYQTGSTFTINVRKNGTNIGSYTLGGSVNLTNQFLKAGDVIDTYVASTYANTSALFPLQVLSSRPIVYPTTPSAGERVIEIRDNAPSVTHGSDSTADDVYTFTAVPKAGVYRIRFGFNMFGTGTFGGNTRVVVRANGVEYYSQTLSNSGYPLTLPYVDMNLPAGAVVTVSNLTVSGSGMATNKFHGATLAIASYDTYPA